MVAQHLHDVLNGKRTAFWGEQVERAALTGAAVAETSVEEVRVVASEVEIVATLAPAALNSIGNQVGGGKVKIIPQGDGVGDGVHAADPLGSPVVTGGLEHPSIFGISDQEAVVVVELMSVSAIATLPVRLQETGDHFNCLWGSSGALQRQP
ncbi:MAG: hypothetical protein MUO67_21625 [Anaerolineales bacterium]|nr:hypothetical protein [Anaerolineales bacterium]